MVSQFDSAAFRARFPSTGHLTYLNSGSYGLLANEVKAAFQQYLDTRLLSGADWGGWVGLLEQVRAALAGLLGAHADEIAITASASSSFNAVASTLEMRDGRDTIVVTDADFPTGAQIWHAQERAGWRVLHVPEAADGAIPIDAFDRAIDERTALVALSHLCYRHGRRMADDDIRAVAAIAHARGAHVLIDSYQIVGTLPIDPHALDVDFMIGGMLKYLVGTAGIGFLWVRPSLVETLHPRASGWFAQADVSGMDIHRNRPSPTARRFEAGTPPVPSLAPALAGIELIAAAGLPAIGDRIRQVTRYAMDRLDAAAIGFDNPREDKRRGPLIAIPAPDAPRLVDALLERQIVTTSRDGRIRAGFHAYNDEADVDRFVEVLATLRDLLF
jgi:selenocysteine lyase/cysteine desulfurase